MLRVECLTLICLRLIYSIATTLRLPKHSCIKEEETWMVECLVELVNVGGWRSDNGTFRAGYLNQLARMMAYKVLGCNVHASTIDSRIKLLKRMFRVLAKMRNLTCSGFQWNDEEKCIITEKKCSTIGSRCNISNLNYYCTIITNSLTIYYCT